MFYTSAWCLNSEEEFESNVPLLLLGDSIKYFNSELRITILFLEGFEKLSVEYKIKLYERNIDIIDYSKIFSDIVTQFNKINKHYNHYERNCFLRWVAFYNYIKDKNIKQFYHIDSDIILHTSLEEIATEANGLTFMTLGCPVFLTVTNFKWFNIYIEQLLKLNEDIDNYLKNSNVSKLECKANDWKKFNLTLFREPIGSDQDLLEFLISSNILIQSDQNLIVERGLYYVQNPLHFSQMSSYLKILQKEKIIGDNYGHIYYAGKKIPFTHFQGTFCFNTAKIYILISKLKYLNNILLKIFLAYNINSEKFTIPIISKILLRIFANKYKSRSDIIKKLMSINQNNEVEIIKLLNIINKN